MNEDEFLERLKELCQSYDKSAGNYPESPYEGFALYYFALHRKEGFKPTSNGVSIYDREGGKDYLKEIGVDT